MADKSNRATRRALERSGQINRDFKYEKNTANLSFSLRIDEATNMIDFLELLKAAVEDVAEQIEETKKKK